MSFSQQIRWKAHSENRGFIMYNVRVAGLLLETDLR